MDRRQQHIRSIVERIAAEGGLAEGWSVDAAVDLIYVVTMPGAWRGSPANADGRPSSTQHLTRLIRSAFLTE